MVIDRSKHNKYSVNLVYTPSSIALTEQQTALSGSSLTIYISGGSGSGSGLTEEQLKKLESIEEGALVNQNAFSTVLVSDSSITNEITAQNPSDTIKFTYVSPIKISLIDGNIQISYEGDDALWRLDENGNLWTDRNVYSTKEISAYGFSEGGSPSGGANYLYELSDVDSATATSPIDNGILQYNAVKKKWVVTNGSGIKPDLTDYATKLYVTELINLLVGTAPDVLDTIYEIAEALNNDPDYVKDIANNLSNLTNRVVKLEDMFEWDNGRIKAKADLYGVGEISAYGYSSGSTPTGAQYLSELLDVDLTNLADQCILQYNILTKKWEATDGSNIKPDLSLYATRSWVISQLDTTSLNLKNEFNADIDDINNLLVVINGKITSLQSSVSSINEEILSIKANITTIKGDITNIKAALELLNNMFEWDGTRIKAKADLYGIGEISAYGYQDGSAGSGAQYLHELLDVTLTELTSGLLLLWNGSKWVNINKDEVGLNESELLQYLTENNYAKKSDIPKTINWVNVTNKPSWITDQKPTYSWTDITNKPTIFTTNIGNISDLNSSWDSLLKNKPTAYITRWPSFSEVTNKPTTLSGYGITDGVNSITLTGSGNAVTSASINGHVITLTKGSTFSLSTHNHDSVYVNVTGDTMTGTLTLPTIVVNTRILLGNAYIEYDSTNNAVVIKNKTTSGVINFYATGEVSAYGFNDGESSSGVSYLSELKDVNITSISENDMLVWNGSKWYNVPMSDISPELNLDNVLDLNANWVTLLKNDPKEYVTRWPKISEVTNKLYLIIKLNSGTTEGTNLFTYNATTAKTINITPSTIGAAASSHNHSWANITSGKPTTLAGYGITDGVNALSITGSGNAITAASVSGHTLTLTKGSTFLLSSAYTAADVLAKLKTVDGSGSGLDADLFDGQHSNYYVINKASGNVDFNTLTRSGIYRLSYTYTEGSTNGPVSCAWGQMLVLHGGGDTISQIAFDHMNKYIQVRSGNPSDVGGSGSWRSWRYLAFKDDNVASATKLQTSRTIWGRPFDGTANVSGSLTGVTSITASGDITTNRLKITNTDGVKHIEFSRASYNYITAPANGYICFQVDGAALSAAACDLQIQSGSIHSGNTNATSCGTSTYRWSHIYSVLGNFSGLITATAGLTTPQYIQIGSGRIYWDSANKALYVKSSDGSSAVNFYATGEVSAYGAGSGGSSGGGVSYLHELSDVTISNQKTDDMLKWNGSKWVNVPMSDIKPDLTDYVTKDGTGAQGIWNISISGTASLASSVAWANVTGKPTTLSGYGITDAVTIKTTQTITGVKTFSRNTASVMYLKNSADTSNYVALCFMHKDSDVGGIAGDKDGSALYRVNSGFTNVYKLLDTSNYSTTLDTRYVKKAGDTMTGALITKITDGSGVSIVGADGYGYLQLGNMNSTSTAQKGIICGYSVSQLASLDIRTSDLSGGVTINRNKIWHAGNDGAGSGLDADKLYGFSYNSYESYRKTTIDASDLNNNTWYPVVMVLPAAKRVRIRVEDVTKADASWNNRADKQMGLVLDYTAVGSAWGWVSENRIIYWYNEGSGASSCLRGLGQLINNSAEYIFVRGGAKYNFYLSHFIVPKLYTTIYTGSGGQTIAPTTSMPAAITRNSALITDNVASANKLYNPRTIWGKSFDGTANISGALTGVTDITSSGNIRTTSLYANNGGYVYTDSGWFQNNTTGKGLYNLAEGARWYASGGVWRADKGIITTGDITTNRIKITDTDAVKHIEFSRASCNYITTPANGYIGFHVDGAALSASECDLLIQSGSIHSGTTNATSCGASTYRWSNVYSVLGNFSGAVTFNGTTSHNAGITSTTGNFTSNLKVSGTSEFISQTIHRAGIVSTTGSFNSTLYVDSYLTANSGVIVPYTGNTWISMATRSNLIRSSTNNSDSSAHALYRVKNSGGDAIVFGGLGTDCGFYGFTAEQISAGTNGTNWRTVWDVATGKLTHDKAMSVFGAVTLSSTLSVASTSTFTGKTTHNGGLTSTTGTFTGAITVSGESTFSKLLHVNGGAHTPNNQYFSTFNTSGTYCSMLGIDGNNYGFVGTTEKIAGMVLKSYDQFLFTFNGSSNYVTINKSGITCKGEITAFSSSDIRLKKNLKELKAINTLRKINTFEYDWTEEALLLKTNKNVHDYGIIAQELELIIPEAVTHDMYGKGYLGIDYTKLIPFTISAIKEVDDEVTTLKKRVKELEDRLSKYESSVK